MPNYFRKKKSILALILSVPFMFAVTQYFELKNPDCADAQCINITPEVRYFITGATNWTDTQPCVITTHLMPFPFSFPLSTSPRNFAVVLKGWAVYYTDAAANPAGDDNWALGAVEILENTIVVNGNTFSFDYRVCLADIGPDRDHGYQLRFMAFAWPVL